MSPELKQAFVSLFHELAKEADQVYKDDLYKYGAIALAQSQINDLSKTLEFILGDKK